MAKRNGKGPGVLTTLLVLCVIAFGLWWLVQDRAPEITNKDGHKYQMRKTGAGIVIDFVPASRAIDAAVLKTIKESGFKSNIGDVIKREVPRTQVEGVIKWENRRITVVLPAGGKVGNFEQSILRSLQKTGGGILSRNEEILEGKPALRINIGIVDTLEGEPITLITHNIWLLEGITIPVAPPPANKNIDKEENYPPALDKRKLPVEERNEQSAEPKTRGKLALVIDDFGLTMEGVSELMGIDRPLTFAILPYHAYSAAIARQAVANNKQVMLHLPMEPLGGERMETSTILTTMSDEQIRVKTREALVAVPEIIGVNNHQGSKATSDARVMKAALSVIREKGIFFVDSRTSPASVAYQTAQNMGIRSVENDHFIDNSSDVNAIKEQLRVAGRLAVQHGNAVAIGHIRPNTVIAIKAMISELDDMGVKLIFVSELVN